MHFFKHRSSTKKEDAFWQWFKANEERIFTFELDREAIFDEIEEQLRQIDLNLTFEFGSLKDGKREFVISAGGIRSAFPAVESLHAKAPPLEKWIVIKFRQRRLPLYNVEFGGKNVKTKDVQYLTRKDGEKVGIVLFMRNYNEEEEMTYMQIGYLFLDQALGEYAVETQVGFIEFQSQDSASFQQSLPLETMSARFDQHFSEQVC